ncbi:MAG: MFS transporter [Roseiflexaceae bacterium]
MERAIRNVLCLSAAQAFGNAGLSLIVLSGGLIGASLAPAPAYATLPPALHLLGIGLGAWPAMLLIRGFGRQTSFVAGAILSAFCAIMAAFAIIQRDFRLCCLAFTLLGINGALIQQYRFAASEAVAPSMRGRAVAFVVIGSVISGVLGPELTRYAPGIIAHSAFAGAFVGLAGCYTLSAICLSLLNLPSTAPVSAYTPQHAPQHRVGGSEQMRPLAVILRQPICLIAIGVSAVGFAVMGFQMAATPLQITRIDGYPLEASAWVIQSHFLAMFLPSFVTGLIVDRIGSEWVLRFGAVGLAICLLLGLISHHLQHYWLTLLFLGASWNMLFVGGTVLLSQSYRPAERLVVQAVHDGSVFTIQAITSLFAGPLLFSIGWIGINMIALLLLIPLIGMLYWLHRRQQRQALLWQLLLNS